MTHSQKIMLFAAVCVLATKALAGAAQVGGTPSILSAAQSIEARTTPPKVTITNSAQGAPKL